MRINFEDMIYNYEVMSEKILDFCNIARENHIKPKTLFNPEKSIKNTQVFKKFTKYADDVKYIEEELKDYLYDFKEVERQ